MNSNDSFSWNLRFCKVLKSRNSKDLWFNFITEFGPLYSEASVVLQKWFSCNVSIMYQRRNLVFEEIFLWGWRNPLNVKSDGCKQEIPPKMGRFHKENGRIPRTRIHVFCSKNLTKAMQARHVKAVAREALIKNPVYNCSFIHLIYRRKSVVTEFLF